MHPVASGYRLWANWAAGAGSAVWSLHKDPCVFQSRPLVVGQVVKKGFRHWAYLRQNGARVTVLGVCRELKIILVACEKLAFR